MEINVSGTEFLEEGDHKLISDLVKKTVGRHEHAFDALDFKINAHRESGERKKFVVHLVAQTSRGYFNSEAHNWKLNLAVKEVLSKLDKHMHKVLNKD